MSVSISGTPRDSDLAINAPKDTQVNIESIQSNMLLVNCTTFVPLNLFQQSHSLLISYGSGSLNEISVSSNLSPTLTLSKDGCLSGDSNKPQNLISVWFKNIAQEILANRNVDLEGCSFVAIESNFLNFSGESNTSFLVSENGGISEEINFKNAYNITLLSTERWNNLLLDSQKLQINENWKMLVSPLSYVTLERNPSVVDQICKLSVSCSSSNYQGVYWNLSSSSSDFEWGSKLSSCSGSISSSYLHHYFKSIQFKDSQSIAANFSISSSSLSNSERLSMINSAGSREISLEVGAISIQSKSFNFSIEWDANSSPFFNLELLDGKNNQVNLKQNVKDYILLSISEQSSANLTLFQSECSVGFLKTEYFSVYKYGVLYPKEEASSSSLFLSALHDCSAQGWVGNLVDNSLYCPTFEQTSYFNKTSCITLSTSLYFSCVLEQSQINEDLPFYLLFEEKDYFSGSISKEFEKDLFKIFIFTFYILSIFLQSLFYAFSPLCIDFGWTNFILISSFTALHKTLTDWNVVAREIVLVTQKAIFSFLENLYCGRLENIQVIYESLFISVSTVCFILTFYLVSRKKENSFFRFLNILKRFCSLFVILLFPLSYNFNSFTNGFKDFVIILVFLFQIILHTYESVFSKPIQKLRVPLLFSLLLSLVFVVFVFVIAYHLSSSLELNSPLLFSFILVLLVFHFLIHLIQIRFNYSVKRERENQKVISAIKILSFIRVFVRLISLAFAVVFVVFIYLAKDFSGTLYFSIWVVWMVLPLIDSIFLLIIEFISKSIQNFPINEEGKELLESDMDNHIIN